MMAHMYFPKSRADREQALLLLNHERERYERLGSEYQSSDIVSAVVARVRKSEGQRYVAGLVAIAMVGLKLINKLDSLETASKIVSEYCYDNPIVNFSGGIGNDVQEFTVKPRTGPKNIRNAFRDFAPVAHICAANISSSSYLAPRSIFSRAPLAEACCIQTAAYFQMSLKDKFAKEQWRVLDVVGQLPASMQGIPALLPENQVSFALFDPYFSKVSEAPEG